MNNEDIVALNEKLVKEQDELVKSLPEWDLLPPFDEVKKVVRK